MSGMTKVVLAFVWAKGVKQGSHPSPLGFDAKHGSVAEQGVEIGADHLDGRGASKTIR
jgi:hypothetical protein